MQKHPTITPPSFPQVQAPIVNNPAFWERVGIEQYGTDTLFLAHIHLLQLLALHAVETMCYTSGDISKTASLALLQPYTVGKCSAENNECKLT